MNDLYLIAWRSRARTRTLSVEQNYDKWYDFTGEQDLPLAVYDVILMRKDPPFDTNLFMPPIWSGRKKALIVNKPQSLRDCNEAVLPLRFSELTRKRWSARNKPS